MSTFDLDYRPTWSAGGSPIKRAAIYLRVSTVDQTVANQEQALREAAERSGLEIIKVYRDHGISGAKGRDKRPGFDALCRDATILAIPARGVIVLCSLQAGIVRVRIHRAPSRCIRSQFLGHCLARFRAGKRPDYQAFLKLNFVDAESTARAPAAVPACVRKTQLLAVRLLVFPEILEPIRRQCGVTDGGLD
jgi:hypothetical protein